jgi:hypothetical protein
MASIVAGAPSRLILAGTLLAIGWLPWIERTAQRSQPRLPAPAARSANRGSTPPQSLDGYPTLAGLMALTLGATVIFAHGLPIALPERLAELGEEAAPIGGRLLEVALLTAVSTVMLAMRLPERLRTGTAIAIGYAIAALGFWGLGRTTSMAMLALSAAAVLGGTSIVLLELVRLGLRAAPDRYRGLTMAIVTATLVAGQMLSPDVSEALLDRMGPAVLFGFAAGLLTAAATVIGLTLQSDAGTGSALRPGAEPGRCS